MLPKEGDTDNHKYNSKPKVRTKIMEEDLSEESDEDKFKSPGGYYE